ncbi:MAG: DUF945 family protein [Pseudomonas sp.]|uniref:DUF945 family protein n=1 Tax=Pseudomonas sp. TaxID=306 RepID=UPI00120A6D1D|nr:DUF945 family protein [Pseudomonas sp.]RZI74733.1 MAG: DUF945 family protein [Pseudomonas sp.]
MKKQVALKASIAALAAAALLYTGTSAWIGGQAQARYESWLADILPVIDPAGTSTRTYRKGIFSSEATLSLALPAAGEPARESDTVPGATVPPAPPSAPLRVTIVSRIQHGPVVGWRPAAAEIESRIASVDGGSEKFRALFADVASPVVRVLASFTGAWEGGLHWSAGRLGDASTAARWSDLNYLFAGSADGKRIEGSVAWPTFNLDIAPPVVAADPDIRIEGETPAEPPTPEPSTHLALAGLSATFHSQRQTPAAPWLLAAGKAAGTIESLTVLRGDAKVPVLTLQALDLQSDTQVDANQQIGVVQTIAGRGALLGTALETFRYEVALERLDGAALLALQKAVILMSRTPPAGGTPDAQVDAALPAAMGQALGRFLDAGPAYRVQLDATVGGKAGQAKGHVSLIPAPAGPAAEHAALPPELLLLSAIQRLEGAVSLRVPKSWPALFVASEPNAAESAAVLDMTLGMLEAQSLLGVDSDAYSVDIQFSQGVTRVNGKPWFGDLAPDAGKPTSRSRGSRSKGRAPRQ